MPVALRSRPYGVLLCLCLLAGGAAAQAERSASEILQLGERIYREGLLPDGRPVRALVAGDVPVDGRMFACVNCHLRSGLGSVEGAIVTWPITGQALFAPKRRTGAWRPVAAEAEPLAVERRALPPQHRAVDARPAYDEATLAGAIRSGVAADGRPLNPAMPRYDLSDADMAALIQYLKARSREHDPGVDAQTLRFATVVTEGVAEQSRAAMLSVLRAHIEAHNTQTRPHWRRASLGPFYMSEQFGTYRKLALDVWELKGPPGGWRDQLEAYYRARPVFALLGGIGDGSWEPVHAFCEEHAIPAILPITDQPVVSERDWYTLYFSKGVYQEGEVAARFLLASGTADPPGRIVQVYRAGSRGEALAQGFEQAWSRAGGSNLLSRRLEAGERLAGRWWRQAGAAERVPVVVLLWLAADELAEVLGGELATATDVEALFASASLLDGKADLIPRELRQRFYLTHPHNLPGENEERLTALRRWLQARGIAPVELDIQSRMYFLGWLLPDAIAHLRGEFYRDYFLEGFDMVTDQDYAIAPYPRLSFGPGQRYAAKGCYVVRLAEGAGATFERVGGWVIH